MYIVMVATECAPVAQAGGLGDVCSASAGRLKFAVMRSKSFCRSTDLWVPWYGGAVHCSVWFGYVHGRKCYFIEPHSQDHFFNRASYYGFPDSLSHTVHARLSRKLSRS
jgi:starch synthase